jgi:hypothetical protein
LRIEVEGLGFSLRDDGEKATMMNELFKVEILRLRV